MQRAAVLHPQRDALVFAKSAPGPPTSTSSDGLAAALQAADAPPLHLSLPTREMSSRASPQDG
jgi:hypothetical protein